MSTEEEYYIKLYVKGKFVRDPVLGIQVVKYKEINLYVEHEIDITIFYVDDLILAVVTVDGTGDGNEGVEVISSKCGEGVESLNREGVEVAGSECGEGSEGGKGLGGGVDFIGSKCGEGVEDLGGKGVEVAGSQGGEGGEALGGKGVEVAGSQGSEGVAGLNGLDASVEGLEEGDGGLNGSVEEDGEEWVEDESDSDLKDVNVYLIKVMYFSDGDDDEKLQEARQKVREVEGKTSGKAKEAVLDETESENSREQFEAEVPKEVGEGLNDRVDKEEEGNETEYFNSDDHESIRSDDDDNTNACKRSRFLTYNPNSTSPHFCIGWCLRIVSNSNPQFVSTQCVVKGNLR
ncbi:hypothetical protein Gogos_001717 [Gossypium gossypioides]|uniref:Uncharacterized protein n=1 Tax=Gossypium gossypioides TaxID=34282 RepID=A0A7J9CPH2_GOSGO|nr:hypothetical protein [Gossypium gossypioides]